MSLRPLPTARGHIVNPMLASLLAILASLGLIFALSLLQGEHVMRYGEPSWGIVDVVTFGVWGLTLFVAGWIAYEPGAMVLACATTPKGEHPLLTLYRDERRLRMSAQAIFVYGPALVTALITGLAILPS